MKINPEELFQEENAVNRWSFFKFLEVGDRLYGTLTGIRRGQDGFGNEQTIYEVLTDEGEYKLFGNKKPIIDDYMKHVKLGQVVGFELVEKRKTTKGKNPANIIQPYANPNLVNEEWVKENSHLLRTPTVEALVKEVEEDEEQLDVGADEEIPFDDTPKRAPAQGRVTLASPAPAIMTKAEKIKEIGEQAKKKLGATDVNDIKEKVMEVTNLAFVEKNL